LGYPNSENKGGDHRMNKLLRSLTTLTIILALGSSLSACGFNTTNKTPLKTKAVPNAQTRMLSDTSMAKNNVRTADQMARSIEKVSGVSKATVIVNDHNAVVGLGVNNNKHGKKLEKHVYHALTKKFPAYKIYVTTDKALNQRIVTAHTQMIGNHPIKQFATTIGTIIRDIGRTITKPFR
jgi:YhcN/YlaJ family sporulation lipoprotein